jgi:hypothetical protein
VAISGQVAVISLTTTATAQTSQAERTRFVQDTIAKLNFAREKCMDELRSPSLDIIRDKVPFETSPLAGRCPALDRTACITDWSDEHADPLYADRRSFYKVRAMEQGRPARDSHALVRQFNRHGARSIWFFTTDCRNVGEDFAHPGVKELGRLGKR